MKWEKIAVGQLCEITSSKRIFYSEYVETGVPFYRSKEIIESFNGQKISEPLYIREEKYAEIKEKFGVPVAGDMLLTSVGTIGVPYIVKDDDYFYFKDGNLTWFRNFDDKLLSKYLYLWISSQYGQAVLNNMVIGSSQRALTISALKSLQVELPPIGVQNKIVDILSTYDDLIENNRRQIKLLEEAAQRLYKEWFVDLRFPGWEETPIVDGVPEGWRKTSLEKTCSLKKDVLIPKEMRHEFPYIGLEHMPRNDICLCNWGCADEVNSNKFIYHENDILFGKIRPYFHKVGFALNDGVASTDALVIQPENKIWGLILMTLSSDLFVRYTYQTCKEGSKMPRADWDEMKKYNILVPDSKLLTWFENFAKNVTHQIKVLAMQSRNLSESRDRLLPKLMSGELEVTA
ncbi:MAG: restriction endonuclease subunit S [Clostridiales bacterium]|nr:restriction endonuclease subunit S [Clostridiales bacterium]